MKPPLLTLLALLGVTATTFAQTKVMYFENKTADSSHSVALWVEGTGVGGSQSSGPNEGDGAHGTITGNVLKDGLLHVTYNYTIEGSQQSEEQLLKLDGGKLFIGEGELKEAGPGQMILVDRDKVTFKDALQEVPLSEPALDSAEGKAITSAMQGRAAKLAGVPVTFEGSLRVTRKWARFTGNLTPAEGKKPKDKAAAAKMTGLQFQAYLTQDGEGKWKVVRATFAQPDGTFMYDEDSAGEAPWPLDDEVQPN